MKLKNPLPTTTTKIKEAAKKLFAAKGFDSVTVKEIGKKSRANPALINYHFGGKQELYYSILEDFTTTSREFAKTYLRKPHNQDSFIENLDHYIRYLLRNFLEDPSLHLILQQESEKSLDRSKLSLFENQLLEVFHVLAEYYSSAAELGLLKETVNPRITTLLLFSTFGMLCRRHAFHEKILNISLNHHEDFEAIAQTLLQLYGSNLLR